MTGCLRCFGAGDPGSITDDANTRLAGVAPLVYHRLPVPLSVKPGVHTFQLPGDLSVRHDTVMQQQGVHLQLPIRSIAGEPHGLDGIRPIGFNVSDIPENRRTAAANPLFHLQPF